MNWKIEKSGDNYHVQVYSEDDLVCLDRDVEDFISACRLVDEFRDQTKDKAKEQVAQYDTAFWLHTAK